MVNLIGDIHEHATPLKNSLGKLGYNEEEGGGIRRHSERKEIFLDDFIGRGRPNWRSRGLFVR